MILMELRHIATGFLLAFLIFLIIGILLFSDVSDGDEKKDEQRPWVRLKYLDRVGLDQTDASYTIIEKKGIDEINISITMHQEPLINEIVLLKGPWVGAVNFDRFSEELEQMANQVGWTFRVREYLSIRPSISPRCIIIPSGAWPKEIVQNWDRYFSKKDLVVFMGIEQNAVLDSDSRIYRGELDETFLEQKGKLQIIINETRVWRLKRTLDEYKNEDSFSKELFFDILKNASAKKIWNKEYSSVLDKEIIVFEGLKKDETYWVRIALFDDEQLIVWDREHLALQGEIRGGQRSGGKDVFQIILEPELEGSQELEFFLEVIDQELEVREKRSLVRQTIDLDEQRQGVILMTADIDPKIYEPGYNVMILKDQYGREYAKRLIKLQDYGIELVSTAGAQRKYMITQNGQKAIVESVLARKEGETRWQKVEVADSEFSIESKWENGDNKVEFFVDGILITDEWTQQENRWANSIRWGVVALALVAIFIYIVSRRRTKEYVIIVPEEDSEENKQILMSKSKFIAAINEISKKNGGCSSEELADYFSKKRIYITDRQFIGGQSIQRQLERLKKKGELTSFDEYYSDAHKNGLKDIRMRRMEKKIKDAMLQQGELINRVKKGWLVDSNSKSWMIYEDVQKLCRLKKNPRLSCIL
jgi:hypothetical protein